MALGVIEDARMNLMEEPFRTFRCSETIFGPLMPRIQDSLSHPPTFVEQGMVLSACVFWAYRFTEFYVSL